MLDTYKHLVFDPNEEEDFIKFYPYHDLKGFSWDFTKNAFRDLRVINYLGERTSTGCSSLSPFDTFNERFLRTEKTPNVLYMGVELEIELARKFKLIAAYLSDNLNHFDNTWAEVKKEIAPFALMKSDGSIPPVSARELVTLPMSLGFHRLFWKEFFTLFPSKIWKLNRRCGLHIHMDARTLTPLHQTKIVQLVNNVEYRKFFEDIIGERKSNRFARYQIRTISQCFNTNRALHIYKDKFKTLYYSNMVHNKYSAVNTGTGKGTIEFRLFKGQKTYDKVMKAIEFVDAIYHFTRDNSLRNNDLTSFLNWIGERGTDSYPELTKILLKKGSLKTKLIAA